MSAFLSANTAWCGDDIAAGSERETLAGQPGRRLRIVFLTNLYPPLSIGGYEQICHGVAEGLMQRGHEVTVVTSDYRAAEGGDGKGNVRRVLRLASGFSQATRARAATALLRRPFIEWRNGRTLRRLLQEVKPDVSVCWNAARLGSTVLSALEESGPVAYFLSDEWMAPLLAYQGSASGTPFARMRRAYQEAMALAGLPSARVRADRLLFCSQALIRRYERRGATLERPTVVYHGVAAELFSFQPQRIVQRQEHDPLRLLYVGQITPQKGIRTLLSALKCLGTEHGLDRSTLTLVGPQTNVAYVSQVHQDVEQWGLGSSVTFLPARPRASLCPLYAAHDILAFPSEWDEPFSVALLEAMATGIPVVGSLRGGSAEIIRDQQNAIAFEAGNASDLAQKLSWMASHPLQAAALGRQASKDVGEGFTLEAEVCAVERYLASLLRPR